MRVLVLILIVKMVLMEQLEPTPAAQQIVNLKQKTECPIGIMTTSAGAPIEYNEATNTLNRPLIFNEYLMDSLTHTVKERIPERVVHAKAGGAFGYFEVTHDITDICKADLFNAIGKKTPIAARFSISSSERGTTDTTRDIRGFAIKFYTADGNFDIAGLNTPIFMFKDPVHFTSFTKSRNRNPSSNLYDANALWDFLTLRPETFYICLLLSSDIGIPDGYRHMPGYSVHTYELVNMYGNMSFVRFHFLPDGGIKNLLPEQAMKINGIDPDYATRDLYNAIGREKFPEWTVKIQVLSLEEVKSAGFDVFDVSKILALDKYPLRSLGRFVLNKNPKNYFAEIEQLAFYPGNLVPGILGAPDKLFEARILAYKAAQYHRLGANFNKIPVNCPIRSKQLTYNRDGSPPVKDNGKDMPNYYPNSFNGPVPYKNDKRIELIEIYQDEANNYIQAAEFYANGMTKEERSRMIHNIILVLENLIQEIQEKAVKILKTINSDLGNRVQQGLHAYKTKKFS